MTGAADIPVRLIERIREELPFSLVVTGYGLSEAGTASATTPDDDAEVVATTVGRARPGFEIRIVHGDRDLPTGEAGEVVLRGPSVMAGYLDDPTATTASLSPDGWLRTGDLGVLDELGNLRIVGRSKDMFIVGGFNAYPAEIENALLRHPDVQQAAVIGIPDDRFGEVGMAFVVTHSGDPGVGPAILAWCKDQMANYKVPRAIELLTELPVNATGKVVKDELRARRDVLLHRALERAAARLGARDAVLVGDERFSFADLDGRSNAVARHLAARGVGQGRSGRRDDDQPRRVRPRGERNQQARCGVGPAQPGVEVARGRPRGRPHGPDPRGGRRARGGTASPRCSAPRA